MSKKFKLAVSFAFVAVILTGTVGAMHIMEGFLPIGWSIGWGIVCLPFLVLGFYSIKKQVSGSSRKMLLLAMCGAFTFVLSALKLPSVTGSCSHPTGTGLGAILFGALPMAVIGTIVLLFQALLLAHGGVSSLGANVFSMAIAGPFVSVGVYWLAKRMKLNRSLGIFLAAFLGDLVTYMVTSGQLAFAFPDPVGGVFGSLMKFLGVFAITQLPIAISEGLLTVIVFSLMEKYSKEELALV